MSKEDKFIEKEYLEAISTYRTQYTLYIQLLTVLIVGNITVLGFGISSKVSGVIAIASIFPLCVLMLRYYISYYMLPIVFVAISNEQKLKTGNSDRLASTYFSFVSSYKNYKKMLVINEIKDQKERFKELKKLAPTFFGSKSRLVFSFILVTFFGQIFTSIILSVYLDWTFI